MSTPRPRPRRLCDYRGYACRCQGYQPEGPGTSRCVCGHQLSQHTTTGLPDPDLLRLVFPWEARPAETPEPPSGTA